MTERRLIADEAARLLREEPLLRSIVRHMPAAVAMFDADLRYLMVSDRWYVDYGLEETDILGRSHFEIFPETQENWRNYPPQLGRRTSERARERIFAR